MNHKPYKIINGDSLQVLDTFDESSIDAIITDPPYELGFMGKSWDASGIAYNVDLWKKALRVLKPGGYLLAFGGSRTFHRIACAIEDAGFEIRDTIMWLYGSGFPKSMSLSKGLEAKEKLGNAGTRNKRKIEQACDTEEYTLKQTNNGAMGEMVEATRKQYVPDTDMAKKWDGWGTCLKPAFEPIIVARKPFNGSLIENIEKNGVGGLNIDGCRIDYKGEKPNIGGRAKHDRGEGYGFKALGDECAANDSGRFPANVILTYDETDKGEVCGGMPDTNSQKTPNDDRENKGKSMFIDGVHNPNNSYDDNGSAARYFYCAKASKKDRDNGLIYFENVSGAEISNRKEGSKGLVMEGGKQNPYNGKSSPNNKNFHPTVKPVELMQYLIRLVCPKGSTILDIFNGSGSTGKAAMFENRERNADYKYIGIELDSEYCKISESRIDYALNKFKYDILEEIEENKKTGQLSIFDFGESDGEE